MATRSGLVVVALMAAHAQAGPLSAPAQALFDDGNAAMARHDAATAAARYRAAWQEMPDPRVAINLGIALAELGRYAEASEALRVYLAEPGSDPAKRPVLERQLARWRPGLGELVLDVAGGDGTVVEIDGVRALRAAPGTHVPVAPGAHRVVARSALADAVTLQVSVRAGETVTAHLALARRTTTRDAAPRVAPGADDDRAGASSAPPRDAAVAAPRGRPWKWIALGAGAATAAAGGYFGVSAIRGWHEVHQRCPDGACTTPADVQRADDARRAGTRADLAFAATGAAVIAAYVLWRLEPGRHGWLALAPHAGGGMLAIGGAL